MADVDIRFVLIIGMSGAGKTQAANLFEDSGYYCMDNIPPVLISSVAQLLTAGKLKTKKVAVNADLHGDDCAERLSLILADLTRLGIKATVLFLDASDDELLRRYNENRRLHPLSLSEKLSTENAITAERNRLTEVRDKADYVIDTTYISVKQLKQRLRGIFAAEKGSYTEIECISFGFKYGIPKDVDLIFDVRCLPNPFYVPELAALTGLDKPIVDYLVKFSQTNEFFAKLSDLIDYSIPLYLKEGKSSLVIGIGCTGGRHRSVAIAEKLCEHLKGLDYSVSVSHRDIAKQSRGK